MLRNFHSASARAFTLYILIACIALITACNQQPNTVDDNLVAKALRQADSLDLIGQKNKVVPLLARLRQKIPPNSPAICDYYCFMVRSQVGGPLQMDLYADSALAFFNTPSRKQEYNNLYFRSLLTKGDAALINKKYNIALRSYYEARKIFSIGNCDDGYVAVKMAGIYYIQGDFKTAAMFWAESSRLINTCNGSTDPRRQFYTMQGALNNSAVSYEKAGMLDSALYYYLRDLELIKRAEPLVGPDVEGPLIVVYDNLGGLYLKKGNIARALSYLNMAIGIDIKQTDGIKTPPFIKLAELYIKIHQYDKARWALAKSRAILDLFPQNNIDSDIKWNKLYAELLFKKGIPGEAYLHQQKYIRLRDSLTNMLSTANKLDVGKELQAIYQQQTVKELAYMNREKQLYLLGAIVTAVMAVIIIFLTYRNLQRSRKLSSDTDRHNQKLQQTLDELERANQNYVRIMRVMAHDLRNPLSGITGLAAMMLSENELNEENRHMLQLIETTGTHTMEMINELLKAGLANEDEVLEVQKLDLAGLLYDSVELLQFKAREKDQQIAFESGDTSVMASVNREKIWRVFNNLIVNAIKFSHAGSAIQVKIGHNDHFITISVADNGIGITDKDKDSVFEMFTPAKRVGTSGEQPFGLGLSICKKIVESHQGRIWFESNVGSGTVFYIQLPYMG